jgi:integrative and conjugative element protein (TIGR02256 family)
MLTVTHANASQVLLESTVLSQFGNYLQTTATKPEAGGILLGFRRNAHLHVVEATAPQPNDRRSLFSFLRRDKYHMITAVNFWQSHSETGDYLGEWHTHPEVNPTPSAHDMSEWHKIWMRRCVPMLFVIVGTTGALWVGVMDIGTLKQCSLLVEV